MVEQNNSLTYIDFAEGEGLDPVTVSIGMRLGSESLKDENNVILESITEAERREIMDLAVNRQ